MCIGSGTAFGAMAAFGKLAYEGGATAGTLLSVRFALAAALFWMLAAAAGPARELRSLPRSDLGTALALGAVGYSLQAGCFFVALERIDASLLSLLLYTFPAIVTVAAIALGRERVETRRLVALTLTSTGLVLVLAGARTGTLDPVGAALGLAAACVYSAYTLVSDGLSRRVGVSLLSALVCTGAAVTLTAGSAAAGELRPGELTAAAWGWIGCLALVSTVVAVHLFFAGLSRVGPTTAAILATFEPLVTVLLSFLVFGERLGPIQLLGGALVLAAVLALNARLPTLTKSTDTVPFAALARRAAR